MSDKPTRVEVGGFPVTDKSANRERAAFRLVELLAPAFVLQVACPACGAVAGDPCEEMLRGEYHANREAAAESEFHQILLTLGIGT